MANQRYLHRRRNQDHFPATPTLDLAPSLVRPLLRPPHLERLHVLRVRPPPTQRKLVGRLVFSLVVGGYLQLLLQALLEPSHGLSHPLDRGQIAADSGGSEMVVLRR